MKSAGRRHAHSESKEQDAVREEALIEKQTTDAEPKQTEPETKGEAAPAPNTSDLRTRISNAVKAINDLGGQADEGTRSDATEDELQTELEELTSQYKRLKSSNNCESGREMICCRILRDGTRRRIGHG